MAMKKRVRILVNPSARSGRGPRALRRFRQSSTTFPGFHFEWIESRSAAHFVELCQRAQDPEQELHALGVAGGDGTVTLALSALCSGGPGPRVPLGILPIGSGNDFAHDLGLSSKVDAALATLLDGVPRFVDIAEARPQGARFCCVASVGLDELALRRIHGSRFPRSKALNIYAALRALFDYEPRAVRVSWQGGSFSGEMMFCAVTNTRSYGGGFQVSPRARIDDGLLDLCIVRRTAKLRLLGQFPRILSGTHGAIPEVLLAQSPWVRIESAAPGDELPLCIDGELPSGRTPVELSCQPRALLVLSPAPAAAALQMEAAA